jgi:hypothetical protein
MTEDLEATAILSAWRGPLDKDSFIALSKCPAAEQVAVLGAQMDSLERAERETMYQKGTICVYVERTRLWAEWPDPMDDGKPYHSFDAWMGRNADGDCRTSRYAARTFVLETADLPAEKVRRIPAKNAKKFLKVPKHRRGEPKVLEAAINKTKKDFEKFVEDEVPEAHEESRVEITFNVVRSAEKVIEAGISAAMLLGANSREEALEEAFAEYMTSHQTELEGLVKA